MLRISGRRQPKFPFFLAVAYMYNVFVYNVFTLSSTHIFNLCFTEEEQLQDRREKAADKKMEEQHHITG